MVNVRKLDGRPTAAFVPAEFLPPGKDENYLRNQQFNRPVTWRHLRADEIETLVKNNNTCSNWDDLLVGDPFDPRQIKNSEFAGLVRIACMEAVILEYHELEAPAGIYHSRIVSCDIGQNAAIHNVRYLAHYILGDHVMLLNIDEMHTTNHAKFGNGIVKDGEPEDVRVYMDLINETSTRAVMPFEGMLCADAYIWARYRDDAALMRQLGEITQKQFDSRRGFYGEVGDDCVIKNSQIIKDVHIGPACYIKGANKLKNLTIRSSEDEPSQIGEGVEMVNGIVGFGCKVFYGCKAVRFVMGTNSNLKYGARLIHSYLGDNSTVSCCELLHNLIFPAHEQHHNNSFLTASLVLGQSNIAAGATIGSNHNSRANDGELVAGRGFWPGLCVTLKHCCRFASYILLTKGDYPCELDIPLPFSLVSNDTSKDRLVVVPAYWWMYNMYALARNSWKFSTRDKRKTRTQHIEADAFAPDTIEEIIHAMSLLEIWVGKAHLRSLGELSDSTPEEAVVAAGEKLLGGTDESLGGIIVLGEKMEASRRPVIIRNSYKAYRAYRQMVMHYAMRNLVAYLKQNPSATRESMLQALAGERQRNWVNLGGQLVIESDAHALIEDIKSGRLGSWSAIHQRYDALWAAYPLQKQRHALACLLHLLDSSTVSEAAWDRCLEESMQIQEKISEQVYITRKKDYENQFRQITFRNSEEMAAVMGDAEHNSFVRQVRAETDEYRATIEALRNRQGVAPASV